MGDLGSKCSHWCDFCEALSTTGDIGMTAEYTRYSGNTLISRTIYESDHFAVVASLGQIVEGYLLILAKPHYPSMSHLPVEYFEELDVTYHQTRFILSKAYTEPIVFEHGPMPLGEDVTSPAEGGGSCVDHAHFHVVPVSVNWIHTLKEQFSWRTIVDLAELRSQAERMIPYFFLETPEGYRYVFDAPVASPQYMRRLLADVTGVPDRWNWHYYPEIDRVFATVQRLKRFRWGGENRNEVPPSSL